MSVFWLDTSVALSEGVGSCAGRSGDSTTMVSSRSVEDVAVRDGVGRDLEECEGLEGWVDLTELAKLSNDCRSVILETSLVYLDGR